MGLYFGEENASTGRSSQNEKGFWERRDVRMINDSILFTADCDWDLVSKFDAGMIPTETNAGHKSAIADVVVKLDAHRPWFVKEPRLCVTFPIWRATLEQPICIHIGRNPLEVAHSLNARNGIPIRVGLALWEFYNTRALQAASGLPLLSVSYEDLVGAPDPTVDSIRVFLAEQGYRVRMPGTSELSGFLDANLRHHRKEPAALSHVATAHQLHLYRLLSSHTVPVSEPDDVSRKCLETLARYESTANVADRRRLAQQRRKRRRRSEMELQIALRDVELRHALGAARQLETKATHLQDVRRNLETQLAATNERIRTLQNEKAAIQRDVANKVAHLQDVRRNLEAQLAATNERVRTLQEVANKATHLQDVRRNLETQLAASNERIRTLQNEKAAIQRDVANKVAHLQDVRRNLEAQLAATNERVRTLQEVANKATHLQDVRRNLETQLAASNERIRTLQNEKAAIQRDVANKVAHLQDVRRNLEAQLAATNERVRTLQEVANKATHLQDVRRNLETQLAASNERIRTLQNEKAAIQRDVANKVAHLQDVRRNLEAQLAATNERVRTLQEVANKATHLQDVRRNLETQLAASNERIRTLQNEKAAIQRDVANKVAHLQDVRRNLEAQLAATNERVRTLQEVANKATHLQDVRRNLETQLAASNERVRTLRADKTTLQQHKANYDKLVTRHDQLKQDLGQRQRQTAELERRYHRLERERHGLQLEHAESVRNGKRDRKEVRAVRRKNAELHVRQLRMERELHHFRRQVAVLEGAKSSANQKVYSRKSPVAPKGVADASAGSGNTRPRPRPPIGVGGIDVVVCVHNALEYVQRCLESVLSRSTVKFRVVIVNDGSDQPTTDWLRGLSSRVDRVDLVETHGPIGYTRAANLGLRATQTDRVVLLNSDTIVPRLWLEGLLECMASDDKIGIVGPLSNAATWQSVPERVDKSGGWAVKRTPARLQRR